MPTPLMRPQSASLRFVAVRLGIAELPQVVRQPGIGEALRVTIQYHDARHPDQIATLSKLQAGNGKLTVAYRRASDHPLSLDYDFDAAQMQHLTATLRMLKFDTLDDASDIPYFGADLWLVERAAGSFHHDVIFAPLLAQGAHLTLMQVISEQIAPALRAINT